MTAERSKPRPTLLIVDDVPANITLLADSFADEYEVLFATSGGEALRLAETQLPDLILLDVMMPQMDGYEVCAALKAQPATADIPVIFVTAAGAVEDELRGLDLGAVDYLTKPINVPITRMRVRNQLKRSHDEEQLRLAASVFASAAEGILTAGADGNILDVNPRFCMMTGYSRDELLGMNPRLLNSGHHDSAFFEQFWHQLLTAGSWNGPIWNRMRNGTIRVQLVNVSTLRKSSGCVSHFVAMFSDIEDLMEQQRQLEQMAFHDALTGLPNRALLADRLQQAIAQARRSDQLIGIGMLDLDGFKHVNDTLGHAAGDTVLAEVSKRLQECCREGDTVARVGGDEFVIVLVGLDQRGDCEPITRRLLSRLRDPILLPGTERTLSASLGIAFFPEDGNTHDALLATADSAMYQAKAESQRCRA